MRYRLGIDVGGTFTDFALIDNESGELFPFKVATTPQQPVKAVVAGLSALTTQGKLRPEEIGAFVHGTTLATNTIIERRGEVTGLLVTEGFEDLLSIGRLRLRNPFDFTASRPEPLVSRDLTRGISERIRADRHMIKPIDPRQVVEQVEDLRRRGVRAIAISFVNSYCNDEHERIAAEAARAAFPDLYICTSSELWPQIREYERTLVSVVNAYVGDPISRYLGELAAEMRAAGVPTSIFVTKSNGGIAAAAAAAERPVELLLSGPAAGVIGASYIARNASYPRIITLDIGGTSADISVVNGEPLYSSDAEVGDMPVTLPAVDVTAIGAGGGSIAWLDAAGVLKVGPRSAGSAPGPACYGLGNTDCTITDAYLALGILDEEKFLAGSMPLRRDLAEKAIAPIARHLNRSVEHAAEAILEVATSNMYRELMTVLARRGVDPVEFTLFPFGGAGATHSFLLADEVGFKTVIIPPFPGVLCALGALVADIKRDFIRTTYLTVRPDDLAATLPGILDELRLLEGKARAWWEQDQVGGTTLEFAHSLDIRYIGQSFEVEIEVAPEECEPDRFSAVLRRFHDHHDAIYGYSEQTAPIEIINIRTTAIARTSKPTLAELPPAVNGAHAGCRKVFYKGQWHEAGVYRRSDQGRGNRITGPAIIEQYDTTTFVPPNWMVEVDRHGNLIGRRS